MKFKLKEAVEVLERTPQSLEYFLSGLSDEWLHCNEGEGTWNAYEVVGHLIQGEKHNWIPRLEHMLQEQTKPFPPFDRFSHLNHTSMESIVKRLIEFKRLRQANVLKLNNLIEYEDQLEIIGTHPEFGVVNVKELISTWVVHDLTHISQIVRIMAKRYKLDVGPWRGNLSIIKTREF